MLAFLSTLVCTSQSSSPSQVLHANFSGLCPSLPLGESPHLPSGPVTLAFETSKHWFPSPPTAEKCSLDFVKESREERWDFGALASDHFGDGGRRNTKQK